jgi:hypothetical protein
VLADVLFADLRNTRHMSLLSTEQISTIDAHAKDPMTWTCHAVQQALYLSSHPTLTRIFIRTASARYWKDTLEGGRDAFISNVDVVVLPARAVKRIRGIECLSAHDPIALGPQLRGE